MQPEYVFPYQVAPRGSPDGKHAGPPDKWEEAYARQRRATTLNQARIFKLWDSYTNGEIGAKKLLRGCAALFGNAP